MKIEILAPAGSGESLIAGVRSGANAVYLGGKLFSARRNAGNFNDEELENAIKYCHERNVKVYLTINTAIFDSEMKTAVDFVGKALSFGIDALIISDLGLINAVKNTYKNAVLHASTQMSVCTSYGAKYLEKLGFCRMVLPREMTKNEIKDISEKTELETEVFVHGALCMCLSGQCRLSAVIGSRSGNRGLCAQPCRLPFSAKANGSADLSLKDLSLIEKIDELCELGVSSLKIEGRMKRPEYVAVAVSDCKKSLENTYTEKDKKELMNVFSRSGFTSGYFDNKLGKDMFGIRSKENVLGASSQLLKSFEKLYEKENQNIAVDFKFICKNGQNAVLYANSLGKKVCVNGDIPEKALNKPIDCESVSKRLSKLGGTQFFARHTDCEIDDGLILSASSINEMRRCAVEKLCLEFSKHDKTEIKDFNEVEPDRKIRRPYLCARFEKAEQIPSNHPFKRIWLPVYEKEENFKKFGAEVFIPSGLFGCENEIKEKLEKLHKAGVKKALCSTIDAVSLAKETGFEIFADHSMNIFNSYTDFENVVMPFELTLEQISKANIKKEKGLIAYGRLPLMTTRNCPVKNSIGCQNCKKHGELTDRLGKKFPVKCSSLPCVTVYNCDILDISDKLSEVKADFADLLFTDESKEEVLKITSSFLKGERAVLHGATKGLYYRGVL